MCGLDKHDWDELTPRTAIKSFFERPKDVTDRSNRFCSFKGRMICLLELALTPIRIVALEIMNVASIVIALFLALYIFFVALFKPSRWNEFGHAVVQFLEFSVSALIIPFKIIELSVRYLLGAVVHPGIALRQVRT